MTQHERASRLSLGRESRFCGVSFVGFFQVSFLVGFSRFCSCFWGPMTKEGDSIHGKESIKQNSGDWLEDLWKEVEKIENLNMQ